MTISVTHKWCVYAHVHQGTVFYVGQGRLGRPFDVTNRNEHWYQLVTMIGTYTIEILGYFDTTTAAKREEQRLLQQLQPACNLDGVGALMPDPLPNREGPGLLQVLSPAVRLHQFQQTLQPLMEERGHLLTRVGHLEEQVQWLEMQILRLEAKVCPCVRPRLWHCWKRLREWRKQ